MDAGDRKRIHSNSIQVVLQSEGLHSYCFSNSHQQESRVHWIPESLSVPKSPFREELASVRRG